MVTVYAIKSESAGIIYIGMTKNLTQRIAQHNAGKSKFTKGHKPWKLIYSEETKDFKEGRLREKYLKSGAGREWLKGELKH